MTPDHKPERVELLPCPNPWCKHNDPKLIKWGRDGKWRVQCECLIYPGDSQSEAEAIAAWNTRQPALPVAAAESGGEVKVLADRVMDVFRNADLRPDCDWRGAVEKVLNAALQSRTPTASEGVK